MSVLPIWRSIDSPTSRGSRPTQMYVTAGSLGIPSSGVWVLMNRRCVWASRSANTSVRARVTMSIHGESVSSGSGSSGSCSMSRAQIICVHVVPHFGGVLMMMSPGRSSKPPQRLLSYILASYRRTAVILAADPIPSGPDDSPHDILPRAQD